MLHSPDLSAVSGERWTWSSASDKFSLSVEYIRSRAEWSAREWSVLTGIPLLRKFCSNCKSRCKKYFQSQRFRLLWRYRYSTQVITLTFDLIFISWPFIHECFWPSFFNASTQAIVSAALDSEQCRNAVKSFRFRNHKDVWPKIHNWAPFTMRSN